MELSIKIDKKLLITNGGKKVIFIDNDKEKLLPKKCLNNAFLIGTNVECNLFIIGFKDIDFSPDDEPIFIWQWKNTIIDNLIIDDTFTYNKPNKDLFYNKFAKDCKYCTYIKKSGIKYDD